jgi:hypothetical protein
MAGLRGDLESYVDSLRERVEQMGGDGKQKGAPAWLNDEHSGAAGGVYRAVIRELQKILDKHK